MKEEGDSHGYRAKDRYDPPHQQAAMDWQWRNRATSFVAAALAVPLGLVWSFAYGFSVAHRAAEYCRS